MNGRINGVQALAGASLEGLQAVPLQKIQWLALRERQLRCIWGLYVREAASSSLLLDVRTELTMQSAGPIRQPWQPITFEFLFKGSEFGHWKVKGGQDAFAFRHPSLGKTEVFSLLASDAHHDKVSSIGTGRLVAMVGTAEAPADDGGDLQILF